MNLAAAGPIVLVGAGRMGGALSAGWIAAGLAPGALYIEDPAPAAAQLAARLSAQLGRPDGRAQAVVLAVKPQQFAAVMPGILPLLGQGTLLISILAGTTIARLAALSPPATPIVRAMPNLPATVGHAMTALCGDRDALAETLMAAVGDVLWLSEGAMDAVTAIAGSGPAYVFAFVEALAAAGEALGLPADVAARLARQTAIGATAMLAAGDSTPGELRAAVTSPGGTTAAALAVLQREPGLGALLREAAAAAARRSAELARDS